MRKSATRSFLILSALLLAIVACHRHTKAHATTPPTETIAPAAAPSSPNGSDAMTQTVDVEDSRSVAEGGTLSNSTTTATGTAAAKSAPAKKGAKGKKK